MAEPPRGVGESRSFGVAGLCQPKGTALETFAAVETIGGKFTLKSLTEDERKRDLI